MSTQDLEARIEELSSDIERQRKILRKLERDKSLVQRQLNAVRDPVARLPLEISSEIFLQCLPPQPVPEADDAPMLLLNICNAWTDIALVTPALWSKIWMPEDFESLTAEAFTAGMERWLRRASTHLLDITMETPLDSVVASVIRCYSSQIQHLEICVSNSDENADLFDITQLEPRLSSLRTLIFRPAPHRYYGAFPAAQILHLLRVAPELTEFSASALCVAGTWTTEIVLQSLRRFEWGYEVDVGNGGVLKYLSAPQLEFLRLATAKDPNVVSFLRRSSPSSLKEVVIQYGPGADTQFVAFDEFLSLLGPSVMRLKIGYLEGTALASFFDILAGAGQGALPNLQTLELDNMGDWSDWRMLIRALSAPSRRAGLRSVNLSHFNRHLAIPWSLDDEIRAEFQQLVVDGMDICIRSQTVQWLGGDVVQLFPTS